MSCREYAGSSACVSFAHQASGLDEPQVQSLFHRLKREGDAAGEKTPGRIRQALFYRQQESRVRHEETIGDARRQSILDRLDKARDEDIDGSTFYAMQHIQAEAEVAARYLTNLRERATNAGVEDVEAQMTQWAAQARTDRTVRAPEEWVQGEGAKFPPDAGTQYATFRLAEEMYARYEADATLVPEGAYLALSRHGEVGGDFCKIIPDGQGGYRLDHDPSINHRTGAAGPMALHKAALETLPPGRQTVAYVAMVEHPLVAIDAPDGTRRLFQVVDENPPPPSSPEKFYRDLKRLNEGKWKSDWSGSVWVLKPATAKPSGSTAPSSARRRDIGERSTMTFIDGKRDQTEVDRVKLAEVLRWGPADLAEERASIPGLRGKLAADNLEDWKRKSLLEQLRRKEHIVSLVDRYKRGELTPADHA